MVTALSLRHRAQLPPPLFACAHSGTPSFIKKETEFRHHLHFVHRAEFFPGNFLLTSKKTVNTILSGRGVQKSSKPCDRAPCGKHHPDRSVCGRDSITIQVGKKIAPTF